MLGIKNFSTEDQEEVLVTLSDLISKGTLISLISKMDDSTKDAFGELMEKNSSPDEVLAFLKERVPGADEAARETLADIASDFAVVSV